MKTNLTLLISVLIIGTLCQSSGDNSSVPAPAQGPPGSHCVTGATYCGYILKKNQAFDDNSIRAAYCSGPGKCPADSPSPVEDRLWLSTLYMCLPVNAQPLPRPRWITGRQIPGVCEDAGPRKLEPLVYCEGEGAVEDICLNPDGDHIGRCKVPGNAGF